MPNKSDAPMQSRMVVIEFEPLEDSETPDVNRWGELKYTFDVEGELHDGAPWKLRSFVWHGALAHVGAQLDDAAVRP